MAAEIRPFPGATGPQKLQLNSKLEGHQDVVNAAVLLKGEDGVISISDDKLVSKSLFGSFIFLTNPLIDMQNRPNMVEERRGQLLAQCLSHNAG